MRCAFALLLLVLGGWAASQFVSGRFSVVVGAERPTKRCCIYSVENARGSLIFDRMPLQEGTALGPPVPRWERYDVAPTSIDPVFDWPACNRPWTVSVPYWLLTLPPSAALAWLLWHRWRARNTGAGFPVEPHVA